MVKAWLQAHWVAGALFMAGLLLLLAPFFGADRALLLVYLAGPLYMLHQLEEHWGDRFRTYVNRTVFGGAEALTVADVLLVNLPGVWGLNILALYAAALFGAGWGLSAAYLILVNGIAHVGMAVRFRSYNPGLVTGVLAFIPFSVASLVLIPASFLQHMVGLVVSLVIHGAIVVLVKHNAAHAGR
ncbi:HXXEE domain-containing protein [Aquabacter cavernae]|uniref:HXXEE domain-containing protein n=1 Tax=Aquabacter cavernae TaxID=2496029 RepID=UPI000F8E5CCA|nr:HXXEE domain-containing protein [Aquabacter cavernae]